MIALAHSTLWHNLGRTGTQVRSKSVLIPKSDRDFGTGAMVTLRTQKHIHIVPQVYHCEVRECVGCHNDKI